MVNFIRLNIIIVASIVGCGLIASWPVQAVVNWSECRTEALQGTLPAGSSASSYSFAQPPLDRSKSFVLTSFSGTSGVVSGSNHMLASFIDSFLQLSIERGTTNNEAQFSSQLIECFNDEFNVQRDIVTLIPGQNSITRSIASVNMDRSLVIVSAYTDNVSSDENTALITAELISDTEVVIARDPGATASTTNVRLAVVTFSDESGVYVQKNTGPVILGPGFAETEATLDIPVDMNRAWVYCSWTAADIGLKQASIGCELSDEDTVKFHRYSSGTYTNNIQYYVVEFPPDTVTIERGIKNSTPTGADNTQYTENIVISDVGDPTKAFSYVTNTTAGTGISFPRNRWTNFLANAVLLRTDFWRPISNSTDSNYKYWQVIRFPHYEATGWGWIGNADDASYGGSPGLISFNCDNLTGAYYASYCEPGGRNDYAVQLESGGCGSVCDVTGEAWLGAYYNDGGTEYPVGIIDFDPAVSSVTGVPQEVGDNPATAEDETLDAHWNEETGEVYGWARFLALQQYEDSLYGGSPVEHWGWIKLRGEIEDGVCTPTVDCEEYGVLFDKSSQEFSYWGWNYNGSDHAGSEIAGSGFGWIKFDLSNTSGGVLSPWLRTVQGDVFIDADASMTAAPASEFGATYLIQASGLIKDFYSEQGDVDPEFAEESYVDPIAFPEDNLSSVYRGDIGDVHVSDLLAQALEDGNAYGSSASPIDCDEAIFSGKTSPLSGEVFYCSGDLTINNNLTFYNGIGLELGTGTVVIGGDLIINDNITYFGSGYNYIDHINNLASIAWIVEGSVTINSSVNDLVGAYVVLGDAGAGKDFSTGAGNDQLTISGLVMARSFDFQRTHTGTNSNPEPSEEVVYDGRMYANPPPGLEDFSKILPN